jgi:hypothetical protein
MRSKSRQPATVPPATAIWADVLRMFPAGPLRKFPPAATVVIVNVVVAVPPTDNGTLELPNVPSTFSVLGPEATKATVPAYPPVDVSVIVEVPVLPGDGDEMVMLVAATVIPGLVTATVVVPDEVAL